MAKLGLYKSGVSKSSGLAKVVKSNPKSTPKAQSKQTAVSKMKQPTAFTGTAAPRAAGFTKFIN